MKNVARLILISALGGLISIGLYKAFLEEPEVRTYIESASENRSFPTNLPAGEENSFVAAAEKTVHSVVHVKTAVKTGARPRSPLEFFFGQPPQQQRERIRMGTGSGVIISEDGYIVTNNHVIRNAKEIVVGLNDGQEYNAKVIGADPTTDIALIKIEADDLPYLTFSNSDEVQVGEWVLAVGNPFNLNSTVTAGIISAKGRNIGVINEQAAIESFLQTDAAVNPGNSGGALVNTQGDLVGINSAISTNTRSYVGYSFAVPSNLAAKVVEDLRKHGRVQRAFLGVNISDVNARMADELELDVNNGVYVGGTSVNSAAEEAGIQKGDIITHLNGKAVEKASQLQERIGSMRPGDDVKLRFLRDGESHEAEATLRNVKGTTDILEKEDLEFLTLLGGSFRNISEEESQSYGIDHGVVISEVKSGILREQGVPKGYILTHVNQQAINEPEDINEAIENRPDRHPIVFYGMLPNGQEKFFVFNY